MKIGINGTSDMGSLERIVAGATKAASDGFSSYWLAQIFNADALTAITVAAAQVPEIEFGTAVIPIQPRHPQALAAQALTTQAAIGNRLALGIGLSHQFVVEHVFGQSFEKPARHMREYLSILGPALNGGKVQFKGETMSADTSFGPITVPGAESCPVLIAALAPLMLKMAGTLADGTITWMTGPGTVADHIVPTMGGAAEKEGRPAPRVVVG